MVMILPMPGKRSTPEFPGTGTGSCKNQNSTIDVQQILAMGESLIEQHLLDTNTGKQLSQAATDI